VIAFGGAAATAVIVLHRQNIRRLAGGRETRAKPWRQQLRGLTARAAPSSGRTP
jgi:predicted ABC-class ATPase